MSWIFAVMLLICGVVQADESTSTHTFRVPIPQRIRTVSMSFNNKQSISIQTNHVPRPDVEETPQPSTTGPQGDTQPLPKASIKVNSEMRTAQTATVIPSQSLSVPSSSWWPGSALTAIVGSLVVGYGSLLGAQYLLEKWTRKKNSWADWMSATPYQDLVQIPQAQLVKNLAQAVQEQYQSDDANSIGLDPFARFLQDIEQEKLYLELFLKFNKFLHKTYLNYIVPRQEGAAQTVAQKIERLGYLKSMIGVWLADSKLKAV